MAEIPGYVAGTWDIDPVHSEVAFTIRHMAVSKVRGRFDKFEGVLVTGEDPLSSTVTATIDATSINTNNEQRDGHIKSADFFAVETHPHLTFTSTGITDEGGELSLHGDLTIRGVTRPVTFSLEINGFGPDPTGGTRAGFSATAEINRQDFGVTWSATVPGVPGALVVSDKVSINLEIEAVLQG
jgi:polyisoprenoid-binding protein YceI